MPEPRIPPTITLLVARARGGVIGHRNRLPWRLPEDMRHFKATTLGHSLIMGRHTFESIGKPLPGRRTIVLSRDPHWRADGCERAGTLEDAIALAQHDPASEIFVVGGEQIYRLALPFAQRAIVTEIELEVEGDAWFPELDPEGWHEASRNPQTAADGTRFAIVEFRRRPSAASA